jgi:transposase
VPMLADCVDAVIGVDTHRDTHHAEIAHPTGAVIAACSVASSSAGCAQLLAWARAHAPGPRLVLCIEGTRSYGAGLARAAAAAGFTVVECEQPARKARRGTGKSDPIDAHLAVLTALRLDAAKLPTPRADGDREALRILLSARAELTSTATGQASRLRALLRDGTDRDADLARRPLSQATLATLARRRPAAGSSRQQIVRHAEIRRLALALQHAARALKANTAQLSQITDDMAPGLTSLPGIGPVTAAQAIVAFSHPGRCRHEAAFARLAGTSPIEASSGQITRHRLNRGGDRTLNQAIHTIARTRMRADPATRAYTARRRAQGKTDREIRRCLKRYITRQLYRALTTAMTT